MTTVSQMLLLESNLWVLERSLPFTHDISVIAARSCNGETVTFPVSENIYQDGILHMTIVPARIPEEVQKKAVNLARQIADQLNIVGLLTVEFFVLPEGLLINEIAPRPHNSGHYTFDACLVSQFEQFIRAVCNLPLGSPELLCPVVMINILGKHVPMVMRKLPQLANNFKVHFYGQKGHFADTRKMGHLVIKSDTLESSMELAEEILEGK